MPEITVRRGEFEIASAIMSEAARWLVDTGQPLWTPQQTSARALRERCMPENVLVAYSTATPVATALLEWRDDRFWPGVEDAGFIHRLAVTRQAAGQGFAEALLDWAAGEAAANGKRSLRLDCLADRPRLCAFYERCGFTRTGTLTQPSGFENALYQRPLETTSEAYQ